MALLVWNENQSEILILPDFHCMSSLLIARLKKWLDYLLMHHAVVLKRSFI